jgi:hypothetical protein
MAAHAPAVVQCKRCGPVGAPHTAISYTFVALTYEIPAGAMVQRLARGPFKAEIRVRFPLALPKLLPNIDLTHVSVRELISQAFGVRGEFQRRELCGKSTKQKLLLPTSAEGSVKLDEALVLVAARLCQGKLGGEE